MNPKVTDVVCSPVSASIDATIGGNGDFADARSNFIILSKTSVSLSLARSLVTAISSGSWKM